MTKLEELKNKYKELGEEIEKLEKAEKSKRWKPEKNEVYFRVDDCNDVMESFNNDGELGNKHYMSCNCFKTKEKAENHAYNLETEMLLRKYAEEHNEEEIDWENRNQIKWYLIYDVVDNTYESSERCVYRQPRTIYFTDEYILCDAVKSVGKERVIKYLKEM